MPRFNLTAAAAFLFCSIAAAQAAEDLSQREEAAIKAAVAQVSPSVVRIETLVGEDDAVAVGDTLGFIESA